MENDDFSIPIRQSSKGIIIIFGVQLFQIFKRSFVLIIAFGLSLSQNESFNYFSPNFILMSFIGVVIYLLILATLKFLNFKFYINGNDFHLSTGIINKENKIIPKSKIQNVYIKQNFLQQIINVVSLNIETAGDDSAEIEIHALDKSTAIHMKNQLFTNADLEHSQTIEIEERNVFFKASIKRLLLDGITQNHIRSFLIIASFFIGAYFEYKDYLESYNFEERASAWLKIENQSILYTLFLYLFIALFLLMISLLFSVIKSVILNFNLEVIEHRKNIEINKGFFNKISNTLTPSRIQNLVIKTNRLKQIFGLHTMNVMQAMASKKQHKNFAIVALEKHQLIHLIQKIYTHYSESQNQLKPELYYKRVLLVDMLVAASFLNLISLIFLGDNFWWINILIIPITLLYIKFGYSKSYFSLDDNYITVGSGIIDTKTDILEIHKIQSVIITQNIFQKRRKIASLKVATASKRVTIPYVNESMAYSLLNFLLFKVETSNKDWM